jgi:hypothetical protein
LDAGHLISSGVDAHQPDLFEQELAHVSRHDRYVPPGADPLEGADAVVIATHHFIFGDVLERLREGRLLVDSWNATGVRRAFGLVPERAVLL